MYTWISESTSCLRLLQKIVRPSSPSPFTPRSNPHLPGTPQIIPSMRCMMRMVCSISRREILSCTQISIKSYYFLHPSLCSSLAQHTSDGVGPGPFGKSLSLTLLMNPSFFRPLSPKRGEKGTYSLYDAIFATIVGMPLVVSDDNLPILPPALCSGTTHSRFTPLLRLFFPMLSHIPALAFSN
ncbi:hypothetical protein BDZ45DRAFT_86708 [Acephala macrosclerotiorum]|nr:hypothetical protein BDZ45DRAFT_86708 [Acephala macrosclerotiorum]